MSIIKLIMTVNLAVALITMITSNQPSIYASPTTEDDGWTEGDYEGSQEEQEEQAQEDWEDAGRREKQMMMTMRMMMIITTMMMD